jgi:hypothetical protein
LIGRIARLLAGGTLRELLAEGATDEEIYRAIGAADAAPRGASAPKGKP